MIRIVGLLLIGWTLWFVGKTIYDWWKSVQLLELKRNDGVVLPDGRLAYIRGIEEYEDGIVLYRIETLEGEQDMYRRDQLVKRLK